MWYNEAVTKITEKLPRNISSLLAIMIVTFGFIFFVLPYITDYMAGSEERQLRREEQRYRIELRVQQELDSINEIKRIKENELFIYKNNAINDLMNYLERRFPSSSHITIYSVHNGGGVPKTGNAKHQTVIYTVDNVKGINILKEYENYPLYPGYAEFAYQMLVREGKPFYVPDVTEYPAIYNGETASNMDKLGTKSMYGMWIKSSGTHTYYINASFDEVNGIKKIGNFPEYILKDARRRLIDLIDAG